MTVSSARTWTLALIVAAGAGAAACNAPSIEAGHVQDEAMRAHRAPDSFPPADEDYFHDMDGAPTLDRDAIMGRNMWLVWTGGNDRFWDGISATSFGTLDFLKTISSHPVLKYSREHRWRDLGLVKDNLRTAIARHAGQATSNQPQAQKDLAS